MQCDAQALIDAVDTAWENNRESGHRYHLGASVIGKECARAVYYTFWWAHEVKHYGRVLRLFDRGHREEERVVADLRAIGATVRDRDEATGNQLKVSTLHGLFGGSLDGEVSGLERYGYTGEGLLEIKTYGDGSFVQLMKKGVWTHKPEHVAQMQVYMHLRSYTWALYWPVSKNTDGLWPTFVPYREETYKYYHERAWNILTSRLPPKRLSADPTWYACRFCDFKRICHEEAAIDVNCRTCEHVELALEPGDTHVWRCNKWNAVIPPDVQRTGCDAWSKRF